MTEPEPNEARPPGFFIHVVPALLYVVAVFYAGAARFGLPTVERIIPQDKIVHFCVFGGMVFILYHALSFELPKWSRARLIIAAIIASSALGALLELVQYTIPYRDAEVMDWVADTLGALLAGGILRMLKPRTPAAAPLEPAERE